MIQHLSGVLNQLCTKLYLRLGTAGQQVLQLFQICGIGDAEHLFHALLINHRALLDTKPKSASHDDVFLFVLVQAANNVIIDRFKHMEYHRNSSSERKSKGRKKRKTRPHP